MRRPSLRSTWPSIHRPIAKRSQFIYRRRKLARTGPIQKQLNCRRSHIKFSEWNFSVPIKISGCFARWLPQTNRILQPFCNGINRGD